MGEKFNFIKKAGFIVVFLGMILCLNSPNAQAFLLISDFNDGTLQGWTPEPVFNGALFNDPTGGNPGGFMVATDTLAAGGPLLARGPSSFIGDLSIYGGIQWDEYVYNNGIFTNGGTRLRLRGTDGTIYDSSNAFLSRASWNTKSVLFNDPSEWALKSGSSEFEDVVSNVDALFFSMDTSILADGNRESGIDNIGFLPGASPGVVPEPSTVAMLGMGMAGIFGLGRRRKEMVHETK